MAESLQSQDVFGYIKAEENKWKTTPIPLTNSKDWNMYEHIQRCKNVSNGWFHRGKNDGNRPYDDIVTPVINVAFRSEGFNVSDIVPYVNDINERHKSFVIKKIHPRWARDNQLDTLIDECVESSIIYDLVLLKQTLRHERPELVDLTTLAFCDQTDALAGPICIKHNFTPAELSEYKGKWYSDEIDLAIHAGTQEKVVNIANGEKVKTPGMYIEVYELRGSLPETWIDPEGDPYKYTPQMHIVTYVTTEGGDKMGLCLYKGEDKPLNKVFKALKIDTVRSKGRACGRSIVEVLFEPQVWNNYSAIKIKELLDSAANVIVTDSEELGNQKLSDLKSNTILKQERGANTQRLDGSLQNMEQFQQFQARQESQARTLGSASDASLGRNPVSGTPFALENLIVQEGEGIHEYRQGKIATFFADVLYPEWFLEWMVSDLNKGKKFSEEFSYDEMIEIADIIATNEINKRFKEGLIQGKILSPEEKTQLFDAIKESFFKAGNRKFMEILKGELEDVPVDVYVNIVGKQRKMAENADKITNIIREVIANREAFRSDPALGRPLNELLEESGMSPINYSLITKAAPATPQNQELAVA